MPKDPNERPEAAVLRELRAGVPQALVGVSVACYPRELRYLAWAPLAARGMLHDFDLVASHLSQRHVPDGE